MSKLQNEQHNNLLNGHKNEQPFVIRKVPLVIAMMTVMFLAAMESTIIILATPAITKDLAGFDLMSLVFSAYLLTSAITTPLYGWLADRYGRKRMLMVGITIFLLGSALCGMATNMMMLIVYRAIQGIGAGSIFVLVQTIAGDVFPVESRATILGAFSAMWGIAGIAGPLIGGLLLETLSWHWVFYINIPIGIACIAVLAFSIKENINRSALHKQSEHWKGVFTKPTIFIHAIAFLACINLQGFDVYLALYLQSVLGYSAMIAGLSLLPMSISWLLTAYVVGKLLIKVNSKYVLICGGLFLIVISALFATMSEHTPLLAAIVFIFLSGFPLGAILATVTVSIQESVDYSRRGTAMGANMFIRSMGQSLGVAALGVVLNMQLIAYFANLGITDIDPTNLYQEGSQAAEVGTEVVAAALSSGIQVLFMIMVAFSVVLAVLAFLMPKVTFLSLKQKDALDTEKSKNARIEESKGTA